MIGKWIQKIKKNKRQVGVGVLALLLVGVMGVNLLQNSTSTVYAANDAEIVVDPDTTNDWETLAASSNSTENVGRIWTDKSVFDTDYTFNQGDLIGQSIKKGDSDFLVSLSALASYSNERSTTYTTTPLDIVLVLDVSGSMEQSIGQTQTTVYQEVYDYRIDGLDTRRTYYVRSGDEYIAVTWNGGYYNGSWQDRDGNEYEPRTSRNDNNRNHVQFYRQVTASESAGSKMQALKDAANGFAETFATMNDSITDTSEQHRISVVKFSGNETNQIGNDTYTSGRYTYNYSQVVSDLNSYTTQTVSNLTDTINSLSPDGSTRADFGLSQAERVLNGEGNLTGARTDAQKVVIFFTDGEPTTSSEWSDSIACAAINHAYDMKQDGTLVYTIGVFEDANPSDTNSDFNRYMNAVSSNYPQAECTNWSGQQSNDFEDLILGDKVHGEEGEEAPQYYYTATNSVGLEQVFKDITESLPINDGSGSPIEEETQGGASNTAGYLTFTDTLGSYTEITGDTMSLAFADQVFIARSTDSGTTWAFENGDQVVDNVNGVYPEGAKLSTIEITVTKSNDLSVGDKVEVKIPASLIPMRKYDVNKDNGTLTITNAYPVRLFYGVSVKEKAIAALNNPAGEGNADIYKSITTTQTSTDKKTIDFYSNNFRKGSDAGTTVATFTPSEGNSFYYYPQTQLYIDKNCGTQATRFNINDYSTLYYKVTYWEKTGQGNEAQEQSSILSIQRSGADWQNIQYDSEDNAYIDDHVQRLDKPNDFITDKDENTTNTATTVLSPIWEGSQVSQHLGNNGKISYPAPGELEIKKTVDWGNASEETQNSNISFNFDVHLYTEEENEDGEIEKVDLTGTYPYEIFETGEDPTSTGTIKNNGTVTLKAGQRVIISGLPNGAKFEIKEQEAGQNGFTTKYTYDDETKENIADTDAVEGTVSGGTQQSVEFTNAYHAKEINLGTDNRFKVEKVFIGRDWRDTDQFTFVLRGIDSTVPMPSQETSSTITISKDNLDPSNKYTSVFDDITYEAPGSYRYIIYEKGDYEQGYEKPIPAVNYSDAIYRATVNVKDDGLGQLKIDSVVIELMNDDDGISHMTKEDNGEYSGEKDEDGVMTFTNTYSASSTGEGIRGVKVYDDTTGANGISPSKFKFKLEALGGYVNGTVNVDKVNVDNLTISKDDTPMPANAVNGVIETGNVGDAFTFGTIPFDGDNVGNTYVYKVTEISGSETGMTYDETEYTVQIKVTEEKIENDPGKYEIIATVLGNEAIPDNVKFENKYDPTDAQLTGDTAIHGQKVLIGREIRDDETFYFQLKQTSGPVVNTQTGAYDVVLSTPETVTVTKASGMNFKFSDLTFSREGKYEFTVNEVADEQGTETQDGSGMTYSKNVAKVTVNVTDKKDGTLSAVVSYENEGSNDTTQAVFTNVYEADMNYGSEGAGGINITKTLKNLAMNRNDFTFTITDSNPNDDVTLTDSDKQFGNDPAAANETVSMPKLQGLAFDQDDAGKTYTFVVDEVEPEEADKIPGVTYDQSQYQVDIQVFDNGDGNMHTETTVTQIVDSNGNKVENPTPIIDKVNSDSESYQIPTFGFVNTYKAAEVSLGDQAIKVKKTLDGRNWIDTDSFTFELNANNQTTINAVTDGKVVLPQARQVTINKDTNDHSEVFEDITFYEKGTYKFKVTEVAPSVDENGMTLDKHDAIVTVRIDDPGKGQLQVTSVSYDNGASTNEEDQMNTEIAAFTNSYAATGSLIGSENLKVTKRLGRNWLDTDSFEFVLDYDHDDEETVNAVEKGYVYPENVEETEIVIKNSDDVADNDESGSFGNLVFEKPGKYQFIITEKAPDGVDDNNVLNGITYSKAKYLVTVTVTDNNNGTLNVSSEMTQLLNDMGDESEGTDVETALFTNTYSTNPGTTTEDTAVKVKKTLSGREWTNDDAFTFTISVPEGEDYGTDVTMPENTEVTITNATKDFTASFGDITFSKEGTYTFNINEVIPQDAVDNDNVLNGITYDDHSSTVSVTVSDNDQGQLIIEKVVYDNDENLTAAEFTNTYSATGTTSIEVTKDLKGRNNDEWIDGDAFTFTLTSTQDYGADVVMPQSTTLTIDKDTVDHKASFGDITFNKAGDYKFKVTEVNDSKANVTYSTEEYTVSVHVEDENGNGSFTVTPTIRNKAGEEVESIVFENTYTPSSVILTGENAIHGTKTLTGRDSKENETFNFTLTEDEKNNKSDYTIAENGNVASVGSLTDGQASGFNFGDITFTKRGTYTFYVSEVLPEGANESNGYTLEGVTYDNHKETVTVTVTDDYMNNTLVPTVTYDADGVVFTNKYDAAEFDGIPTDFTLTKVFEGKEWSTEDVFEFTLTAGNNTAGVDTPMPANTTVQVNAPDQGSKDTAIFNFGEITYTKVGTYNYTVNENKGTNAGIKYSENVAEITVTVTDNKQGGLVASANVVKGTFTNIYSSELDYVGKGGIELVKNLTGYDLTKDNQFTFTLNAADEASRVKAGMENMSQDVFNTEDTMDANGLSTSTIQLLPNMDKFTQDDVGKVYKYTISETSEQKPGYTNDTTEYTIEISTVDDGKGTLTVSTHITGTNGTDITYEYTQSKQKAETGVAQVVFNNTYTSSTNTEGYDASVNLTGTKTLTNRPMVDGEFQFNVLSNGSVVLSGTNTADGIVTFTPINYTNDQLIKDHANGIASKEGNTYTYVYDVEEVTPGNGVSIVAGKFSVTVKVTDNGDGKLVTNVIYPEDGLAFENAYGQSASAELKINGKKSLAENGTNHPDITDKFEFTITGSEGAPMPEKTTVRNDAAGNVDFGKIVYTMQNVFGDDGQQAIVEQETPVTEEQTTTEDGSVSEETEDVVGLTEQVETYSEKREKTFTYTITESGSLPGVTNDSAKVINVKVIDNGDGTIYVTSDTQGTFTFVNTYVPDPTDETSPTDSAVTIKKILDGRTLKADEFSFTMMDENGNGVQATNAEDGSVVFPKLTFDKEGIYTYTISETNDNKGGVTYDTTTYKAIATVTDDTSGKLKVEWKVTDAQGKEINEITFNNKYTVQPTSLTLGATKVLEGRELADKEFLFVLSDEEGNVVEEAYNDKTGKVTFSDLTFDKAGTYNYTVTEKNTNAKGITYDKSVYNIQVDVVDNEDGTLNMTTTTTKDGEVSSIVFKNKAEKDSVPEQPEKGDTSNTSTQTYAGLFTSLAVNAAALAGIATLLKKRNEKQ